MPTTRADSCNRLREIGAEGRRSQQHETPSQAEATQRQRHVRGRTAPMALRIAGSIGRDSTRWSQRAAMGRSGEGCLTDNALPPYPDRADKRRKRLHAYMSENFTDHPTPRLQAPWQLAEIASEPAATGQGNARITP